jgi:hypothetical protein
MKIFPASLINTKTHWLLGTEWVYSKGVVKMHEDGFSCTCRKNPRIPCNHIKNVKLKIYGTFDEYYAAE